MMKRVFIIGNPRSGTSLLRVMMNSHPNITAAPESGFLLWWFRKYKTWEQKDCNSSRLDSYLADLKSSKKIESWGINYEQLKMSIIQKFPQNYAELSDLVYLHYGKRLNKNSKCIIDKNNYYINHLLEINEIWSDALYIFITRDGRDVACSYINIQKLDTTSNYKPNLPVEIEDIANEWQGNNKNVVQFFENLSKDRKIFIRYEDLLTDTQNVLMRICKLIGLNFDNKMLEYFKNRYEPNETIDWKKKVMTRPDINNIGKYKIELSEKQISTFNTIAQEMLKAFNYL